MHDKLFFSLAILSYPIDPHTLIIDFLSYQASLAYNPKEFLGVITKWRRCRGDEFKSLTSWENDKSDLVLDDRQGVDIIRLYIIYLATP
jgi:hypothetical protein